MPLEHVLAHVQNLWPRPKRNVQTSRERLDTIVRGVAKREPHRELNVLFVHVLTAVRA